MSKLTLKYRKIFDKEYKKLPKKLRVVFQKRISRRIKIDKNEFNRLSNIEQKSSIKALPPSWRPWVTFEAIFTAAILDGLHKQLDKILAEWDASGISGNLTSDTLWSDLAETFHGEIEDEFIALAEFGVNYAKSIVDDSKIDVDWGLVNKNIGSWASQHAAEQVTKIDDATREALRKTIAEWSNKGGVDSDLTERIINLKDAAGSPCFNEIRAERIATTEATTIFAEANSAAWEKLGYPKAVFKPIAHIRCRCYLQPLDKNDVKQIIWYTAHDERVCVEPIDTKTVLGSVKGCRELHGMIVGSGKKKLIGTHDFHFGELEV